MDVKIQKWISHFAVGTENESVELFCRELFIFKSELPIWDWTGLDWTGLDWTGLDWIGLDWIGLDWTGLDWFGLDWIGLDWIGLDWIGLDWIGLDWIGLDWTGLDWTGLVWFGLDWIGLDWTGLDWTGRSTTNQCYIQSHIGNSLLKMNNSRITFTDWFSVPTAKWEIHFCILTLSHNS